MERRCFRCKEILPPGTELRACPLCGADVEGSGSLITTPASWQPVSLPAGLVDEGPSSRPATRPAPAAPPAPAHPPVNRQASPAARPISGAAPAPTPSSWREGRSPARAPDPAAERTDARRPPTRPLRRTLAAGGVLLLVGAGLTTTLLVRSCRGSPVRYIAWPVAVMLSAPGAEGKPLARLQRGERVELLGRVARWCQVRDLDDRVGHIDCQHLVATPPAYTPGTPFFGCRPYATERDGAPCRLRATQQQAACLARCPTDEIGEQCRVGCQQLGVECRAECP